MLQMPMDIPKQYPVRKSKKQKQTFREDVAAYAQSLGYAVKTEKGTFHCQNLILGEPEKANYLVTAHYDTCARMLLPNFIAPCNPVVFLCYQTLLIVLLVVASLAAGVVAVALTKSSTIAQWVALAVYWVLLLAMLIGPANKHNANDNTSGVVTLLEIARSLPENQRSKVAFVLFDLEEAGLWGSASYRKAHKAKTDQQIILNLDCVGDGDEVMLFPTKRLKKDKAKLNSLRPVCGQFGKKSIALREKGFTQYPSDQKNFPYGVGIAAFHRKRGIGLYCSRIHTSRDTILEVTNVNLLRAALITLIAGNP